MKMNEPTTENVEAMISFLADKSIKFGTVLELEINSDSYTQERINHINSDDHFFTEAGFHFIKDNDDSWIPNYEHVHIEKVIGHPVMIGDVLSKICRLSYKKAEKRHNELIKIWRPLGTRLSLNEILGGEVDEGCRNIVLPEPRIATKEDLEKPITLSYTIGRFKDSDTQYLWELLVKLFPNYKQC